MTNGRSLSVLSIAYMRIDIYTLSCVLSGVHRTPFGVAVIGVGRVCLFGGLFVCFILLFEPVQLID